MSINSTIKCYEAAAKSENNKPAGHITWDSIPAAGVSPQAHKFSFIDSLSMATNFLWARHRDEKPPSPLNEVWIKTGIVGSAILMSLPQTNLDDSNTMRTDSLCYIGSIGNKPIFLDPKMKDTEFEVGDAFYSVRGNILQKAPSAVNESPISSSETATQR